MYRIVLVLGLISFLSFSIQFYRSFYEFHQLFLINTFAFLIFLNYYLTTSTDPGGVPKSYKPAELFNERNNDTGSPRYCRTCHVYKPPRAHHCRRSGRCVLRMDHYCPWMNNCIGFYNYGHFIRFLSFVDIGCSYHLITVIKRIIHPHPVPSSNELGIIVANILFCLLVLIVVGSFSIYHFYAVFINTTTIENWEKDKVDNLSSRGKIKHVSCTYFLRTLLIR